MMLGIYMQTTAQAGRDLNFTSAKIHSNEDMNKIHSVLKI
jgi:hypothetical protein